MNKSPPQTETRYSLQSLYLEDTVDIELGEARYKELLNARQALVDAGSFEERYELMVENYKAFEIFFAALSLESQIGGDYRIEPASRTISEANRLLINFLTSVCSYTDQVTSEFKTTPSATRFRSEVTSRLEKMRSGVRDFALLEVVRNFAQHVAMPVEGIRSESKDSTLWVESTYPYISRSTLTPYAKPNRKRPIDIENSLPDKIDLRTLCYFGLRELSKLHCSARDVVRDDCSQARKIIEAAIKEVNNCHTLENSTDTKMRPARICEIVRSLSKDGKRPQVASRTLMLEWDDVRLARATKNAHAVTDFKQRSI